MFETTATTTPILFFDLILMSTLTWMTEKEIKIKKNKKKTKETKKNKNETKQKQRRPISLED